MSVTPMATLLQFCCNTPTLVHHPDLAPAIVNKNVDAILEHLRRQRAWLSKLHATTRARLEIHDSVMLRHAKAAAAALTAYEQCLRTAS